MAGILFLYEMNIEREKDKEFDKELLAVYVQGEDGNYDQSDSKTFPTEGYELNLERSTCINGGTLSQNDETKIINATIFNNDKCTLYFDKEVFNVIKASQAILNKQKPKGTKGVKTNFAEPATTDEGVFEMEDDYGTSYYYRGAVENNYVKFAGFYWRIIRVNGDGSVRMIYDGTMAHVNGENSIDRFTHIDQEFNINVDKNVNDNKYVGWMYSPEDTEDKTMIASTSKAQAQTNTVSSDLKKVVDAWYKANIVDKGYSSAIADEIFCNDRSTASTPKTWWTNEGMNIGYGTNTTAYGAFSRFWAIDGSWKSTPNPKFTCDQKNDAFTVSDTSKGNGALTYPVGLITADEIVTAGSGTGGTYNKSYYLYKGSSRYYQSLSPFAFDGGAGIFVVSSYGHLAATYASGKGSVVPVINLSADYTRNMIGTGLSSDPYRATDVEA